MAAIPSNYEVSAVIIPVSQRRKLTEVIDLPEAYTYKGCVSWTQQICSRPVCQLPAAPTLWCPHCLTPKTADWCCLSANSKWDIIPPSGTSALSSTSNIKSRFNSVSARKSVFRNSVLSNFKILWWSQKKKSFLSSLVPYGLKEH